VTAKHAYRPYFFLDKFNSEYEIVQPTISIHNFIIGTMYVDLGDSLLVRNVNKPIEQVDVKFERRGWLSKEAFKF
jgi:hypothetical protein